MPGYSQGKYISGWRFDWDEARKEEDRFRAAERPWMAAACADPGLTACSTCGETHMAEFEVFECGRCGAICRLDSDSHGCISGPPKYPEKVRVRLVEDMHVRYIGRELRGKANLPGQWPAGVIEVGCTGRVMRDVEDECKHVPRWLFWPFDGRKPNGDYRWCLFGPFIPDEFEKI